MPQPKDIASRPDDAPVAAAVRRIASSTLAFAMLLAFCGTAAAETWTLSWNPATTYADGTPITGKTVMYSVYWSTDPGTAAPMTALSSGVTQTYTSFEPESRGMVPGRTVYFRMRTALNTGEVSDYSAALTWVVPGTAPAHDPATPTNLTIGGVTSPAATGQAATGASSSVPTKWKVAWDPVTKYADGQGLPAGCTVQYAVYWTRDPSLAAASLIPLGDAVAVPSAEFDPRAQGISDNERIYFIVSAKLDTGEESGASEALGWRASNKGPAPPAKAKILKRQ
jgi:hypothetical protein